MGCGHMGRPAKGRTLLLEALEDRLLLTGAAVAPVPPTPHPAASMSSAAASSPASAPSGTESSKPADTGGTTPARSTVSPAAHSPALAPAPSACSLSPLAVLGRESNDDVDQDDTVGVIEAQQGALSTMLAAMTRGAGSEGASASIPENAGLASISRLNPLLAAPLPTPPAQGPAEPAWPAAAITPQPPASIEAVSEPSSEAVQTPTDVEPPREARFDPEPGIPLAGIVPVDLKQLQHGVDAFFEQLAHLGDDRDAAGVCATLAPWLLLAAAAAWEFALSSRAPAPADDPLVPGLEVEA
jgi:hypothetical protein